MKQYRIIVMLESFLSKQIALYVISSWRKVYKISNYSLFFPFLKRTRERKGEKNEKKRQKRGNSSIPSVTLK